MSDLEQRVSESLVRAAGDAPAAGGLAEAARARARGRRRTRLAGAAALAVAVVAVPVAVTLGSGGSGRSPVAPDPGGSSTAAPSGGPEVPDGWRVEAWRGLSVQVPDSWREGGRSAWCAGGGDPAVPVVQRPDTIVELIECSRPTYSLGLSLGSAAAYDTVYPSGHVWRYRRGDVEMYVDGSWLGHWYDDRRLVQVNAADRETVERVLESVAVTDDGWSTVEREGVTADLPPGWVPLDGSGCELEIDVYGPPGDEPCDPPEQLAFYESALFDPKYGPGTRRDDDGNGWSGYTYVDGVVVSVSASSRAVVGRVLDSARPTR